MVICHIKRYKEQKFALLAKSILMLTGSIRNSVDFQLDLVMCESIYSRPTGIARNRLAILHCGPNIMEMSVAKVF